MSDVYDKGTENAIVNSEYQISGDQSDITFNWIRHSESIANIGNNKPSDSYSTKKLNDLLKK